MVQLASLFFLCSGFAGDLLVIRIFLCIANAFLLVGAATGYPSWVTHDTGCIAVDGVVWAGLNLFFHGAAVVRLLWDERRIALRDPEQQEIWQFFCRRSGMGKLEFLESMKNMRLERFKAGSRILCEHTFRRRLVLLVEGLARYQDRQGHKVPSYAHTCELLYSGSVFDIALLGVLGVPLGFEKTRDRTFVVTADTNCLVAFWDISELDRIATQTSPVVAAHWRNFALCHLGLEWSFRLEPKLPPLNARGFRDPEGVLKGKRCAGRTCRSRDFTDPMDPESEPNPLLTLPSLLRLLVSRFALALPPGIRHNAQPHAGVLARNRLLTLTCCGLGDERGCGHVAYAKDDAEFERPVEWVSMTALTPAMQASGGGARVAPAAARPARAQGGGGTAAAGLGPAAGSGTASGDGSAVAAQLQGKMDPSDVSVLVVDDDGFARAVISQLLRQCKYRVATASSGAQALEMLKAAPPGTYHMVLTDVCMPEVSGIELLREVKQDDNLRSVPVIMMSSLEEQGTVYECVQSGAEEYLVKPVTRKDVQHVWQHLLRKQVAAAATVPQAPSASAAAPAASAAGPGAAAGGGDAAEGPAPSALRRREQGREEQEGQGSGAGPATQVAAVEEEEEEEAAQQEAVARAQAERQQQQEQARQEQPGLQAQLRAYGVLPTPLEAPAQARQAGVQPWRQEQQERAAPPAVVASCASPAAPLPQQAAAPDAAAVAAPLPSGDSKAPLVVPDYAAAAQFLRLMRAAKWEQAAALQAQLAALEEDAGLVAAAAAAAAAGGGAGAPRAGKRRRLEAGAAAAGVAPPLRQGEAEGEEEDEERQRRRRLGELLPQLDAVFFQRRQQEREGAAAAASPAPCAGGSAPAPVPPHLARFSRDLDLAARTRALSLVAELRSGDVACAMDMACGVALSSDAALLATVGVCRRIKLFDFPRALGAVPGAAAAGVAHYPCAQLASRSKLSSVGWNAYVAGHLVTGDYDGAVQLWDCHAQSEVSSFDEHARRVWSVDCSPLDPGRILSGSDDGTVRLWSMHSAAAAAVLRAPASVCSVQFSPTNPHLLAFGCADSRAYVYDVRRLAAPVGVAAGPARAISYVRHTADGRRLLGASTDSAVRVWELGAVLGAGGAAAPPAAALGGHANRWNFVGLAVSAQGLVACGSEDNAVYLYSPDLPFPLARHAFGCGGGEPRGAAGAPAFASAVCWAPSGRHAVVANSQGLLQVLGVE
eukprot:scaffold4.g4598.t1